MEISIYLDSLILSGNIRVCGSILALRSRSECNCTSLYSNPLLFLGFDERNSSKKELKPMNVF